MPLQVADIEQMRAVDEAGPSGLTPRLLARSATLLASLPSTEIDLDINFDVGAASVSGDGMRQLNALGTALSSDRLAAEAFVVVGHTDARGTEAFNRVLSKRRADAVRDYLATEYGIDRTRLIALGLGQSAPKIPGDLLATANRRVGVLSYRRR